MGYTSVLQASPLFQGMEAAKLDQMLTCLNPRIQKYEKGAAILTSGTHVHEFGIVLSGRILVVQEDYWGNRNILAALSEAALFAESFAARPQIPLNVSVFADGSATVMFFNCFKIVTTCPHACPHHRQIIENFLAALAAKNLYLNEKLTHISQRTTREKLLSFLSAEARRRGTATFDIPLNRQQLADYLSVDRSALSTELSRLKADGLLDYHRSSFRILRPGP